MISISSDSRNSADGETIIVNTLDNGSFFNRRIYYENNNNNISNLNQQNTNNNKDNDVIREQESRKQQKFVTISIKDTGKGISKETISKIFDKFTSYSGGGMGLGLYISKSIVEADGGRIWVQNNKIYTKVEKGKRTKDKTSKGSTVLFILPIGM